MKLSIVIPVYNSELYIRRLFDSLVNQTRQEFEIIVVDDGSTDNSVPIIREYEKYFQKRLKVYSFEKNCGVAVARNFGIQKAVGEYIGFVDSDDYLFATFCEKMLLLIEDADIVVCGVEVYKNDQLVEHAHVDQPFRESGIALAKDSLRRQNEAHSLWNKVYRRSVLDGFAFFEGHIYEDLYGCAVIPIAANKVVYTDEELYAYCRRSDSVSSCVDDRQIYDLLFNLQKVIDFFEEKALLHIIVEDLIFCASDMIETYCKRFISRKVSREAFDKGTLEVIAIKNRLKEIYRKQSV